MRDDEHDWCQDEKRNKRQFNSEQGQFHRVFEEKITMCHGADRYTDIVKSKKITQPKPSADGGRVLDTFL